MRPETAAKNVGPLNLAMRRRPEDALAEFVGGVHDDFAVKPHDPNSPPRRRKATRVKQ